MKRGSIGSPLCRPANHPRTVTAIPALGTPEICTTVAIQIFTTFRAKNFPTLSTDRSETTMASSKRARDSTEEHDDRKKKQRTSNPSGFSVGPKNLPPGTHRTKVSQIKKALVHKAKAKKELAKLKARLASEQEQQQQPNPHTAKTSEPVDNNDEPASLQPHPDRLALLQSKPPDPPRPPQHHKQRQRRPKTDPFSPASRAAERRKEEAERAARERVEKTERRERHRGIMARARSGGKRSLGTESAALLERVKRLVGRERSEGVVGSRGKG